MKSLSEHILESFIERPTTKFLTTIYQDSAETGNIWDAAVGYIDNSTSLSYCVSIDNSDVTWFRLTQGKKFHDTDKRNWSKKYNTIDEVPAKYANHAEELVQFMDSELMYRQLDADDELKSFMDESLLDFTATNISGLIGSLVNASKESPKFLKKLLLTLGDAVSNNKSSDLNEEFVFERSWFAAIATNLLLYAAAKQVAKINNKWIKSLLMALIVAKVITTNDLGKKLQQFINYSN